MVANFAATHPVRCRGTKGGSYDCFGQVVIGDHNSGHQATIETAFNDDSHTHTQTAVAAMETTKIATKTSTVLSSQTKNKDKL